MSKTLTVVTADKHQIWRFNQPSLRFLTRIEVSLVVYDILSSDLDEIIFLHNISVVIGIDMLVPSEVYLERHCDWTLDNRYYVIFSYDIQYSVNEVLNDIDSLIWPFRT